LVTERSPMLVAKMWENLVINLTSKDPTGREQGNVK
jgi:hypothetical protein